MANISAVDRLLTGDYISALKTPDINRYPLVYAYCLFLAEDLGMAKQILLTVDSIRGNWLKELISLTESMQMFNPTYFEIRNFLELDIDLFIISQKVNYMDKLLDYSSRLAEINKETYKLVARVLFNNNFLSLSKTFLDLYKNVVYYDPELNFIYAKYYILQYDYKKALESIDQCLLIVPEYYPAKLLKKEIIALSENS